MGDRLLLRGSGDELDRLSLTINRLLDQLASHIERQEEFVANAAHELRSPLAAIQSSLEVAILQPRTAIDYQASLEDVLEQTRHLSKLVNDLMLLAESATQKSWILLKRQTSNELLNLLSQCLLAWLKSRGSH